MRRVLPIAALCLSALPAAAQQPAQAPQAPVPPEIVQLRAYVNTPDYVATVVRVALEGEKDIAPECKQPKPVDRTDFRVIRMPAWSALPYPTAGEWVDQIKIDRCGTPVLHNVVFTARSDGFPAIRLGMPGETALSPRLQLTALPEVLKAGAAALKCKQADKAVVTNTALNKVVEQPKANAKGVVVGGKWVETWTVRACGKTAPVTMELASDGQGGATHRITK
ncbi:MAG: hypothetical protein AB1918_02090 [Pseudomonadota bacterium]